MSGPDAPTESDSERDGFLSYAGEWHAFTIGMYSGVTSVRGFRDTPPDNPDVEEEPHYYKGGYLVGLSAQWATVIATTSQIF